MVDPKNGHLLGYEYEVRDHADAPISPENLQDDPCPENQDTDENNATPCSEIQSTENQNALVKQNNTNTPSKRDPLPAEAVEVENENADAFASFVDQWQVDETNSQGRADRLWERLSALEREKAANGVANYLERRK